MIEMEKTLSCISFWRASGWPFRRPSPKNSPSPWERIPRSITSSCYRVYFAEFRRKSRPTMGVLPGLACASILNTNSSCPSWLSWLIR